jgi:hypothetical protein
MELLTFVSGLIIGILTIFVAFKPVQDWVILNIQKLFRLITEKRLKVSKRVSLDYTSIVLAFAGFLLFFGKLFSLLFFAVFPLVLAYFFYSPFQELMTSVFTRSHLDAQDQRTFALFVGIYFYVFAVLFSVYRRLNNEIKILRNRVINLYMLKPIKTMNNEQRDFIFSTLKSSWQSMRFTIDEITYPNPPLPVRAEKPIERLRRERELVDAIKCLETCTPMSFSKGLLSIECPDPLIRKKLYHRRLEVRDFLSQRIEFLTDIGYKDKYPEPLPYILSEVEFLPTKDTAKDDYEEMTTITQENGG